MNVFDVAEVFVSHATERHGSDVGIIAYYGSYALGEASPTSDLDLIYIPEDGKAATLSACFLLEGVCFDFFPISWARAERFAIGADSWAVGPALIANAKVLYARSEADAERFSGLQAQTAELCSPARRKEMLERAKQKWRDVLVELGSLHLAEAHNDLESVRKAGWRVAMACVESLALVNQTYFQRGWDANFEEILQLESRPPFTREEITNIALSPQMSVIAKSATNLAIGVQSLLQEITTTSESMGESVFVNYYPEMRDKVNKIARRRDSGNLVGASWAAMFVQDEVARFLAQDVEGLTYPDGELYATCAETYRSEGFPSLMGVLNDDDVAQFGEQTQKLDTCMRSWLGRRGIALNELGSLDELRKFLQRRDPIA